MLGKSIARQRRMPAMQRWTVGGLQRPTSNDITQLTSNFAEQILFAFVIAENFPSIAFAPRPHRSLVFPPFLQHPQHTFLLLRITHAPYELFVP